jgi:hypothetical protein
MQLHEPWEFGTLGIYDFSQEGPYKPVFDYLKHTKGQLRGDILEAGTFRGRMAMSFAIWLQNEELDCKVQTFDTFSGFPSYSQQDEFKNFSSLHKSGYISDDHFRRVRKFETIQSSLGNQSIHPSNVSTSKDFSANSLTLLQKKIELLGLSNLMIHRGEFSRTMNTPEVRANKWWLVFIDCDLYQGYLDTLNATWNCVLPGGMVFLDEYYSLKFPGALIAVHEFLESVNDAELIMISEDIAFPRWCLIKSLA